MLLYDDKEPSLTPPPADNQGALTLNVDSVYNRQYEGNDFTSGYEVDLFSNEAVNRNDLKRYNQQQLENQIIHDLFTTNATDVSSVDEELHELLGSSDLFGRDRFYSKSEIIKESRTSPLVIVCAIVIAALIGIAGAMVFRKGFWKGKA